MAVSRIRCLDVLTWASCLIFIFPFGATGQGASVKGEPATGSVTGSVTCADTNAPARFAVVTLERVPREGVEPLKKADESLAMNATATTDLEGRFVLDKVPAGRYFVLVILSGYMDALGRFDHDDLKKLSNETKKTMLKAIPTVSVEPGQVAQTAVRLEHASELGGTVLYDDGSPAINLTVKLLRKAKDGTIQSMDGMMVPGFGAQVRTDDRGHFRFIGISPGEYSISVSMKTEKVEYAGLIGDSGLSIGSSSDGGGEVRIFSGSGFRLRDAAITKIAESEVVGGVDVTIPLAALHVIKGTLTAKRDGHVLNRGQVQLLYADDGEEAQYAQVGQDGSFSMPYVPEGKYVLQVKDGADVESRSRHEFNSNFIDEHVVRKYGEVEMAVTVTAEMSGLELAAPDLVVTKAAQ